MKRFAVTLAALTFVLLLMGGLVHNTRSSLACPDWPLCFGTAFPKMEGGVLVEHSHRLMATLVGLLTTMLMMWAIVRAWRDRSAESRRFAWLSTGAFACVLFQGILGGITVKYRLPTLISTAHLAMSMIVFAIMLYIAFRLSPPPRLLFSARVRQATLLATTLVYAQMILGAFMRHVGAGLACVDLFCQGQIWPARAHGAMKLHVAHRLFGVVVFVAVCAASYLAAREARGRIRLVAIAAPVLAAAQIALGIFSITSFLDVVPVTAHLGVAALLLASMWSLHLCARAKVRVDDAAPALDMNEVLA